MAKKWTKERRERQSRLIKERLAAKRAAQDGNGTNGANGNGHALISVDKTGSVTIAEGAEVYAENGGSLRVTTAAVSVLVSRVRP